MRTPSAAELLDAWDAGAVLGRPERVVPLLCVCAGLGADDVSRLGVGECARLLVEVRRRVFGERMRTVVECPGCGLALEVELEASELLGVGPGPEVAEASVDGWVVRFREPRAGDVADAAAAASVSGARTVLVERSVVSAEREGAAVDVADLPDAVVAAAADVLASAHPLLDIEIPVVCEECGARWSRPFDIGAYLWQELEAWAVRTLHDVHVLALAYGWRESDVLALSPARRRHYLELVGDG